MTTTETQTTCRHCGRIITRQEDGIWIDPEATGDDSIWREVCDRHDTFQAEHEPSERVYRFVLEIQTSSESEARERLETLIAQEGLGDLESTYPPDYDDA